MKKQRIKIVISFILTVLTLFTVILPISASDGEKYVLPTATTDLGLDAKSALLMVAETGDVIYELNADEAMAPASVTKIMTLLLVMEAIDAGKIKLDDMVTASAHACSMGGSQIYLKEGEQMRVEDMLKSVVIASANDAACALAEHLCGSEAVFVSEMNKKASELGMKNTNFENTNGLDDTAKNHVTSARDIAIMSRELIKHKKILEYSSIWMDSIRDGAFGLTNTNRLVRFYRGCTGLKTGSTSKAGFCISATAQRDGMTLICVIMGSPTRDARNSSAASLLDWGFANYGVFTHKGADAGQIPVIGGVKNSVGAAYGDFSCVLEKTSIGKVKVDTELPEVISAPVGVGDVVGKVKFSLDGKILGESDICACEEVKKISFFGLWIRMLAKYILR